MSAGSKAGLDGIELAAFEQQAKAGLGGFHGRLAELAALEQIDVLARDRREFILRIAAARPISAQQKAGRHQDDDECYHHPDHDHRVSDDVHELKILNSKSEIRNKFK